MKKLIPIYVSLVSDPWCVCIRATSHANRVGRYYEGTKETQSVF